MKNSIWPVLLVLVAAAVGGIYWYLHQPQQEPPPQAAAAPAPAAQPVPPPSHYPIETPPPAASPAKPLPALEDSDAAAQEALGGLLGGLDPANLFQLKNLIRRIVATIDNLPREKVSTRISVLRPVPGPFVTAGQGTALALSPANYARYAPYVRAVQAADAARLAAAYAHLYPLFQQAYADLGYPDGYFNDRLVQVIDNLLAAPAAPTPRLAQPNVLFTYADPELESLSAGQKMMLRMGPENAAIVKDKLRELRVQVTSRVRRQDPGKP